MVMNPENENLAVKAFHQILGDTFETVLKERVISLIKECNSWADCYKLLMIADKDGNKLTKINISFNPLELLYNPNDDENDSDVQWSQSTNRESMSLTEFIKEYIYEEFILEYGPNYDTSEVTPLIIKELEDCVRELKETFIHNDPLD